MTGEQMFKSSSKSQGRIHPWSNSAKREEWLILRALHSTCIRSRRTMMWAVWNNSAPSGSCHVFLSKTLSGLWIQSKRIQKLYYPLFLYKSTVKCYQSSSSNNSPILTKTQGQRALSRLSRTTMKETKQGCILS